MDMARKEALFDVLFEPERYPDITTWSGAGWVSDVRAVNGEHVGWLVRPTEGDELSWLTTGGPLGDATAPRVAMELAECRKDGMPSATAFDYVLIDREHSDPEVTDLAEFRAIWDSEES